MNQPIEGTKKPYTLTIDSRERAVITGVECVQSFDEHCVVLDTCGGRLTVTGSGMHMESLQPEQSRMTITGDIAGAVYEAQTGRGRRSFIRQALGR